MSSRDIRTYCQLDTAGEKLLENAMQRLGLSVRAYTRILKVARTIADLAGEEHITGAGHPVSGLGPGVSGVKALRDEFEADIGHMSNGTARSLTGPRKAGYGCLRFGISRTRGQE